MRKHHILISVFFLAALFLLSSCYTPSPIYGTWADNAGSKISFVSDGTYTATIMNIKENTSERASGSWTVMENIIIFTKDTGGSINSEWDIRGSILYLYWTDDEGNTQALTLYHVSK